MDMSEIKTLQDYIAQYREKILQLLDYSKFLKENLDAQIKLSVNLYKRLDEATEILNKLQKENEELKKK